MINFERIVNVKRSVIVAADVPTIPALRQLVRSTIGVDGISGFKLGLELGLEGLKRGVDIIGDVNAGAKKYLSIVYDHQKAGNDIPDMGTKLAKKLAGAGVEATILFPFTGPATQEKWTKACQDAGLKVLTGGVMTHEKFLESEGGYISDAAPQRIFNLAVKLGVRHFVVPGNKIKWVQQIRAWLDDLLGPGNYVLYAPGFIEQKGIISECGAAAGHEWHAIVGTAIYGKGQLNSPEAMEQAAIQVTSQIRLAA